MGQLFTLHFYDTVTALSEKTVVSSRIMFPFVIHRISIGFPPGSNRLVQIKIFVSADDEAPTTGEPSGTNIFAQYGQKDYVVGDDAVVEFPHQIDVSERGMYLKVYANNLDSYDHTIDVHVTIERKQEGER